MHCWKDYREAMEEQHGYLSPACIDAIYGEDCPFPNGGTCMLEDGHDGDHEFTPDDEIVVRFRSGGADEGGG